MEKGTPDKPSLTGYNNAFYNSLGGDVDPDTFAFLMAAIETDPPGIYMLRIATHEGLQPAAKMKFAAIMLEFFPEVGTFEARLYMTSLVRILQAAGAAGVRVANRAAWMRLWDALFTRVAHADFWKTGEDETIRQELLLLVHLAVQTMDEVPEQLLVDYDVWRDRIASIKDVAFRDAITLVLQDALRRHGYGGVA